MATSPCCCINSYSEARGNNDGTDIVSMARPSGESNPSLFAQASGAQECVVVRWRLGASVTDTTG